MSEVEVMGVENLGFLLDNLGKDCGPYQLYRELTQNALDAIRPTGEPGRVIWDVRKQTAEDGSSVYKLCVIDTGTGMSRQDLQQFINRMSSSGRTQSFTENFGIGAKIAAATRNPHGLVYLTWKDGQGHMAWLMRDPNTGEYGLRRFDDGNGQSTDIVPLTDDDRPMIRDVDGNVGCPFGDHGTCVLLLGHADDEDTVDAPDSSHGTGAGWLEHYLNTRYFQLPDGVRVHARFAGRSTNKAINQLHEVRGQQWLLDEHSTARGVVDLDDARAWWWVLDDSEALRGMDSRFMTSGHVAAVFQDELYEVVRSNQALARLQAFGVVFGAKQVVIYVQPAADGHVAANAQRTHLQLDGQDLPWDRWAEQFRGVMPAELREHQSRHIGANARSEDRTKVLEQRIGQVRGLLRPPKYRARTVDLLAVPEQKPRRPRAGGASKRRAPSPSPAPSAEPVEIAAVHETGEISDAAVDPAVLQEQTLFDEMTDEAAAAEVPTCVWVTRSDGSRSAGELEDRAARYLPETNIIKVNSDFRVFHEYVNRWVRRYRNKGLDELLLRSVCVDAVREWYELALVQTVISAQAISTDATWSVEQRRTLLSEEALTAAVLQPFHIDAAVKRALGQKLGSLKD